MFDIAPLASLVGRLLLGLFFLLPGILKILNFEDTAQMMADHGLIQVQALLWAAIVLEIVGGLAIITGLFARLGAFLLFFFTLIVNIALHDFWRMGPEIAEIELQLFVKNLAVAGGLLMIVGAGPGRLALGQPRS